MSVSLSGVIDAASFVLMVAIFALFAGYLYVELRNTYRKVAREDFFERVRQKMQEEAPDLRQRLISNLADYPRLVFEEGSIAAESVTRTDQQKRELIVESQILADLDKLYIYSSINEKELQEFSEVLRQKIVQMKIDLVERQQLVSFLERWYHHSVGKERAYLGQFYIQRKVGADRRMLTLASKKLVEERGEEFIAKQRARIFESVRQIIQMTG